MAQEPAPNRLNSSEIVVIDDDEDVVVAVPSRNKKNPYPVDVIDLDEQASLQANIINVCNRFYLDVRHPGSTVRAVKFNQHTLLKLLDITYIQRKVIKQHSIWIRVLNAYRYLAIEFPELQYDTKFQYRAISLLANYINNRCEAFSNVPSKEMFDCCNKILDLMRLIFFDSVENNVMVLLKTEMLPKNGNLLVVICNGITKQIEQKVTKATVPRINKSSVVLINACLLLFNMWRKLIPANKQQKFDADREAILSRFELMRSKMQPDQDVAIRRFYSRFSLPFKTEPIRDLMVCQINHNLIDKFFRAYIEIIQKPIRPIVSTVICIDDDSEVIEIDDNDTSQQSTQPATSNERPANSSKTSQGNQEVISTDTVDPTTETIDTNRDQFNLVQTAITSFDAEPSNIAIYPENSDESGLSIESIYMEASAPQTPELSIVEPTLDDSSSTQNSSYTEVRDDITVETETFNRTFEDKTFTQPIIEDTPVVLFSTRSFIGCFPRVEICEQSRSPLRNCSSIGQKGFDLGTFDNTTGSTSISETMVSSSDETSSNTYHEVEDCEPTLETTLSKSEETSFKPHMEEGISEDTHNTDGYTVEINRDNMVVVTESDPSLKPITPDYKVNSVSDAICSESRLEEVTEACLTLSKFDETSSNTYHEVEDCEPTLETTLSKSEETSFKPHMEEGISEDTHNTDGYTVEINRDNMVVVTESDQSVKPITPEIKVTSVSESRLEEVNEAILALSKSEETSSNAHQEVEDCEPTLETTLSKSEETSLSKFEETPSNAHQEVEDCETTLETTLSKSEETSFKPHMEEGISEDTHNTDGYTVEINRDNMVVVTESDQSLKPITPEIKVTSVSESRLEEVNEASLALSKSEETSSNAHQEVEDCEPTFQTTLSKSEETSLSMFEETPSNAHQELEDCEPTLETTLSKSEETSLSMFEETPSNAHQEVEDCEPTLETTLSKSEETSLSMFEETPSNAHQEVEDCEPTLETTLSKSEETSFKPHMEEGISEDTHNTDGYTVEINRNNMVVVTESDQSLKPITPEIKVNSVSESRLDDVNEASLALSKSEETSSNAHQEVEDCEPTLETTLSKSEETSYNAHLAVDNCEPTLETTLSKSEETSFKPHMEEGISEDTHNTDGYNRDNMVVVTESDQSLKPITPEIKVNSVSESRLKDVNEASLALSKPEETSSNAHQEVEDCEPTLETTLSKSEETFYNAHLAVDNCEPTLETTLSKSEETSFKPHMEEGISEDTHNTDGYTVEINRNNMVVVTESDQSLKPITPEIKVNSVSESRLDDVNEASLALSKSEETSSNAHQEVEDCEPTLETTLSKSEETSYNAHLAVDNCEPTLETTLSKSEETSFKPHMEEGISEDTHNTDGYNRDNMVVVTESDQSLKPITPEIKVNSVSESRLKDVNEASLALSKPEETSSNAHQEVEDCEPTLETTLSKSEETFYNAHLAVDNCEPTLETTLSKSEETSFKPHMEEGISEDTHNTDGYTVEINRNNMVVVTESDQSLKPITPEIKVNSVSESRLDDVNEASLALSKSEETSSNAHQEVEDCEPTLETTLSKSEETSYNAHLAVDNCEPTLETTLSKSEETSFKPHMEEGISEDTHNTDGYNRDNMVVVTESDQSLKPITPEIKVNSVSESRLKDVNEASLALSKPEETSSNSHQEVEDCEPTLETTLSKSEETFYNAHLAVDNCEPTLETTLSKSEETSFKPHMEEGISEDTHNTDGYNRDNMVVVTESDQSLKPITPEIKVNSVSESPLKEGAEARHTSETSETTLSKSEETSLSKFEESSYNAHHEVDVSVPTAETTLSKSEETSLKPHMEEGISEDTHKTDGYNRDNMVVVTESDQSLKPITPDIKLNSISVANFPKSHQEVVTEVNIRSSISNHSVSEMNTHTKSDSSIQSEPENKESVSPATSVNSVVVSNVISESKENSPSTINQTIKPVQIKKIIEDTNILKPQSPSDLENIMSDEDWTDSAKGGRETPLVDENDCKNKLVYTEPTDLSVYGKIRTESNVDLMTFANENVSFDASRKERSIKESHIERNALLQQRQSTTIERSGHSGDKKMSPRSSLPNRSHYTMSRSSRRKDHLDDRDTFSIRRPSTRFKYTRRDDTSENRDMCTLRSAQSEKRPSNKHTRRLDKYEDRGDSSTRSTFPTSKSYLRQDELEDRRFHRSESRRLHDRDRSRSRSRSISRDSCPVSHVKERSSPCKCPALHASSEKRSKAYKISSHHRSKRTRSPFEDERTLSPLRKSICRHTMDDDRSHKSTSKVAINTSESYSIDEPLVQTVYGQLIENKLSHIALEKSETHRDYLIESKNSIVCESNESSSYDRSDISTLQKNDISDCMSPSNCEQVLGDGMPGAEIVANLPCVKSSNEFDSLLSKPDGLPTEEKSYDSKSLSLKADTTVVTADLSDVHCKPDKWSISDVVPESKDSKDSVSLLVSSGNNTTPQTNAIGIDGSVVAFAAIGIDDAVSFKPIIGCGQDLLSNNEIVVSINEPEPESMPSSKITIIDTPKDSSFEKLASFDLSRGRCKIEPIYNGVVCGSPLSNNQMHICLNAVKALSSPILADELTSVNSDIDTTCKPSVVKYNSTGSNKLFDSISYFNNKDSLDKIQSGSFNHIAENEIVSKKESDSEFSNTAITNSLKVMCYPSTNTRSEMDESEPSAIELLLNLSQDDGNKNKTTSLKIPPTNERKAGVNSYPEGCTEFTMTLSPPHTDNLHNNGIDNPFVFTNDAYRLEDLATYCSVLASKELLFTEQSSVDKFTPKHSEQKTPPVTMLETSKISSSCNTPISNTSFEARCLKQLPTNKKLSVRLTRLNLDDSSIYIIPSKHNTSTKILSHSGSDNQCDLTVSEEPSFPKQIDQSNEDEANILSVKLHLEDLKIQNSQRIQLSPEQQQERLDNFQNVLKKYVQLHRSPKSSSPLLTPLEMIETPLSQDILNSTSSSESETISHTTMSILNESHERQSTDIDTLSSIAASQDSTLKSSLNVPEEASDFIESVSTGINDLATFRVTDKVVPTALSNDEPTTTTTIPDSSMIMDNLLSLAPNDFLYDPLPNEIMDTWSPCSNLDAIIGPLTADDIELNKQFVVKKISPVPESCSRYQFPINTTAPLFPHQYEPPPFDSLHQTSDRKRTISTNYSQNLVKKSKISSDLWSHEINVFERYFRQLKNSGSDNSYKVAQSELHPNLERDNNVGVMHALNRLQNCMLHRALTWIRKFKFSSAILNDEDLELNMDIRQLTYDKLTEFEMKYNELKISYKNAMSLGVILVSEQSTLDHVFQNTDEFLVQWLKIRNNIHVEPYRKLLLPLRQIEASLEHSATDPWVNETTVFKKYYDRLSTASNLSNIGELFLPNRLPRMGNNNTMHSFNCLQLIILKLAIGFFKECNFSLSLVNFLEKSIKKVEGQMKLCLFNDICPINAKFAELRKSYKNELLKGTIESAARSKLDHVVDQTDMFLKKWKNFKLKLFPRLGIDMVVPVTTSTHILVDELLAHNEFIESNQYMDQSPWNSRRNDSMICGGGAMTSDLLLASQVHEVTNQILELAGQSPKAIKSDRSPIDINQQSFAPACPLQTDMKKISDKNDKDWMMFLVEEFKDVGPPDGSFGKIERSFRNNDIIS